MLKSAAAKNEARMTFRASNALPSKTSFCEGKSEIPSEFEGTMKNKAGISSKTIFEKEREDAKTAFENPAGSASPPATCRMKLT